MSVYQTYLKDCNCDGNGILFKDNVAVCRWCRTPYTKGGCMNYDDEHFQKPPAEKEVLFTTEDGCPIYHGDMYWNVSDEFNKGHFCADEDWTGRSGVRTFSTEDAADEWIVLNKRCLSFNDVMAVVRQLTDSSTGYGNRSFLNTKLKELAKSKINL